MAVSIDQLYNITYFSSLSVSSQVRVDDRHYELYVAISKVTVRGVIRGFLLGAVAVLFLRILELSPIASMIGGSSLSFAFTLVKA